MKTKTPILDKPCLGWIADLPSPADQPIDTPSLGLDNPNHQDEVFLEIRRHSSKARGFMLFFLPIIVYPPIMATYYTISDWEHSKLDDTLLLVTPSILLAVWATCYFLRLEISPPRDLPIRVNRARMRIYAYNFKYRWWNPFERRQVVVAVYEWSQVRAEKWRLRGINGQGGITIIWGVELSIVKPGTNEVIDRFPLSAMGADEFAWAYICTYMQQGPDALPVLGPPYDHNDVPWYNLALRLAPKVQWPKEIDIESRTAPE